MAEYSWISWKGRAEASSAPGGDASAMLRDWLTEATASSYIDTVVATCRNNMTITEAEELMALGQDSGAPAIGR